jgi:hypothetical protein
LGGGLFHTEREAAMDDIVLGLLYVALGVAFLWKGGSYF